MTIRKKGRGSNKASLSFTCLNCAKVCNGHRNHKGLLVCGSLRCHIRQSPECLDYYTEHGLTSQGGFNISSSITIDDRKSPPIPTKKRKASVSQPTKNILEAVNDQTVPQPMVVTPMRGVTVPSYYSYVFTRKLLDKDHQKYEGMLSRFVSQLIFADMKFSLGKEEYEVKLCLLAINKGYVKIEDRMIRDRTFAEHFHPLINRTLTRFRNKANVNAKRKFVNKMKKDLEDNPRNEIVSRKSLCELLLNDTYRKYLNADGTIIEGREENYEAFTWFVENVLTAINHDFTSREMKRALEHGHPDFVTRVYSTSDEAFALMMIANNESRWRACVLHPTTSKHSLANDEMYAARFTSSKRGYSKLTWSEEGIAMYNEWMKKIEHLRLQPATGETLETCLLDKIQAKCTRKKRPRNHAMETVPAIGSRLQRMMEEMTEG